MAECDVFIVKLLYKIILFEGAHILHQYPSISIQCTHKTQKSQILETQIVHKQLELATIYVCIVS